MSVTPELLPLGSAVKIEDNESIYVIIARGFQKTGDGILAGYKGVPHPQGMTAGVREIVIRGTQIIKIMHLGFENEKDTVFAKKQLDNAETRQKTAPVSAPTPASNSEPNPTGNLITLTPTSTPVVATEGTTAVNLLLPDIVKNVKDPFGELRRKGKQHI